MTNEEAAKHIREPMDRYAHGPQETERWYAAIEEMERRARKALDDAERRGAEERDRQWKETIEKVTGAAQSAAWEK